MPKRFLRRYMPDPQKIKESKSLHFLGDLLHEPNLWHINRHAVSKAFLVGLVCAFIPMPFQMALAAILAVWFNCNLPISVALVWITNPLTMPPIFYFTYRVGAFLLNRPTTHSSFELSLKWISSKLVEVGVPLYFGSIVCGVVSGVVAYVIIQFLWRRKIRKDWQERQVKRQKRAKLTNP